MKGKPGLALVCVGKLREPSLKTLAAAYEKRLSRYADLRVREIAHEKLRSKSSRALDSLVGTFAEKRVRIALDADGRQMSSEKFAALIGRAIDTGGGLSFCIGGPDGLPAALKGSATAGLSFSKMTFPHELFRVCFLEQLYRAFTILHGHPYHK